MNAVKFCLSSDSVKNELIKVIRALCKYSGLEVTQLIHLKIKAIYKRKCKKMFQVEEFQERVIKI